MKQSQIPIIYEDSEIVIINKPQGLSVQGGAGVGRSVDRDLSSQLKQKIFLVHRLDKETSGLLICAKSPKAAAKWGRLVCEKRVKKEYKALCFGVPKKKCGKISSEIFERGVKKNAETFYELEKNFLAKDFFRKKENLFSSEKSEFFLDPEKTENFFNDENLENEKKISNEKIYSINDIRISLLNLRLETGRTHQLRIHLAKEGVPICGDDKHGNFFLNRTLKKCSSIKRLCLCAFRLTLCVGKGERVFEIEAPFLL